MAKSKTRYVCTNCGSVSSRWLGRCPQRSGPASKAASLTDIAMEDMARMETGIGELDRAARRRAWIITA